MMNDGPKLVVCLRRTFEKQTIVGCPISKLLEISDTYCMSITVARPNPNVKIGKNGSSDFRQSKTSEIRTFLFGFRTTKSLVLYKKFYDFKKPKQPSFLSQVGTNFKSEIRTSKSENQTFLFGFQTNAKIRTV